MSDIFISYASEDRSRVEPLAKVLKAEGWSVWWDREIPIGRTFDEVIEEALNTAKCVIVVWTEASVASRWVKAEAGEGAARQILVPVLMGDVSIPLAFRRIQTASLVGWGGERQHPGVDRLLAAVSTLVEQRQDDSEVEPEPVERDKPDADEPRKNRKSVNLPPRRYGVIGLVVLLGIGVIGLVVLLGIRALEPPRSPGIYLKVDGAQGESLAIDMVEIVPLEGSEPVADRPYNFEEHLEGFCLVTPVSADSVLTWENVGTCQSVINTMKSFLDDIRHVDHELDEAFDRSDYEEIAQYASQIKNQAQGILEAATTLSPADFELIRRDVNEIKDAAHELKHAAEEREHEEAHHNADMLKRHLDTLERNIQELLP